MPLSAALLVITALAGAPQGAPPVTASSLTSRPGQGEAAATTPPGAVLMQVGGFADQRKVDRTASGKLIVPSAQFRFGLFERVEGRLFFDAGLAVPVEPGPAFGFQLFAPGAGVSFQVLNEGDVVPAMTVLGTAVFPSEGFDVAGFAASARLCLQKTVFDRVTIQLNGYSTLTGALLVSAGLTSGIAFSISDRFFVFSELFGEGVIEPALPLVQTAAGFGYSLTPYTQFDARIGADLLPNVGGTFVDVGVSIFLDTGLVP